MDSLITEELIIKLIRWISEQMEKSGGKKAVIGISGGKDSTVTAALLVKALGKENVIGVIMPNKIQSDINYAYEVCEYLDINFIESNISNIYNEFQNNLKKGEGYLYKDISDKTNLNLPPRIRMTLLYAISQSIPKARVVNTGNLSERWIGYTTLYGDNTGTFAPLAEFTSSEVVEIGRYLNLPNKFITKIPADGLTGNTDEDVIGFSYETLNTYIRTGFIEDKKIKDKIDNLHSYNEFKFKTIPTFKNFLPKIQK